MAASLKGRGHVSTAACCSPYLAARALKEKEECRDEEMERMQKKEEGQERWTLHFVVPHQEENS